jgi:hypothetical protein
MKIFQLQSSKLPEPVVFEYNSKGLLTAFKSTGLSEEQLLWVFEHFPTNVKSVEILRKKHKIDFLEIKVEVTFEDFFRNYSALYGDRVDKKKASEIWARMSKAKQFGAYEFIPRYFSRCKRYTVAPKMAKTYLNQEPWND